MKPVAVTLKGMLKGNMSLREMEAKGGLKPVTEVAWGAVPGTSLQVLQEGYFNFQRNNFEPLNRIRPDQSPGGGGVSGVSMQGVGNSFDQNTPGQ